MVINDAHATKVGAAVSLLLIAAVVVALRVDFGGLGKAVRVRVYLKHPGPLKARADVQLAGRRIGSVDGIRLVTARQATRPDHPLHPAGGVVLDVRIKTKYVEWVRLNSELFVGSRGLIGESYLEVAPPPANEDMLRPLRDGDVLRGIDPARMEEIIVTSFLNAKRFGTLLKELEPETDALRAGMKELSATLAELAPEESRLGESVSFAANEASKFRANLRDAFGDGAPSPQALIASAGRLQELASRDIDTVRGALRRLSGDVSRIRERLPKSLSGSFQPAVQRAERALAQLETTLAQAEDLADRVSRGIGTVGALMNDKEFSDDAKTVGRYIKRHPWELIARPIDN